MLAHKIPIIGFGVTDIHCPFDAGPCLVHVYSGTGKFEIVHIDDQHAIQFRVVENSLPYIRENLFATLFADPRVQVVFQIPPLSGCPYNANTKETWAARILCSNVLATGFLEVKAMWAPQ